MKIIVQAFSSDGSNIYTEWLDLNNMSLEQLLNTLVKIWVILPKNVWLKNFWPKWSFDRRFI
jgi:hypothetical protein